MAFRPFRDTQLSLGNLQDEMNNVMERFWHAGLSTRPFDGQEWAPRIDLHEYPDYYKLFAELPGVEASGIDVSHVGRVITVRGEKVAPGGDERSLRSERRFGSFCRTVDMPPDVNASKLAAKYADGVLEITIPKTESNRPKPIKIEVQEE